MIHVPTDYHEAAAILDKLGEAVQIAGRALREYPKGPMGLTPDSVKATPEWRAHRSAFDAAMAASRKYAQAFMRVHARRHRDEVIARRTAG